MRPWEGEIKGRGIPTENSDRNKALELESESNTHSTILSYETSGKLINLTLSQHPHLKTINDNVIYLI